jgi:hypothetical protein
LFFDTFIFLLLLFNRKDDENLRNNNNNNNRNRINKEKAIACATKKVTKSSDNYTHSNSVDATSNYNFKGKHKIVFYFRLDYTIVRNIF